jgi:hypothetical protein
MRSVPVLPGGRNSGHKAQKGPQKKKVGRKNLWPNFGCILPKSGRKGAAENFQKKFLIFSIAKLMFLEIGRTFS